MGNNLNLTDVMHGLAQREVEQRRMEEVAARQALERKQAGLQRMAADLGDQIQRHQPKLSDS